MPREHKFAIGDNLIRRAPGSDLRPEWEATHVRDKLGLLAQGSRELDGNALPADTPKQSPRTPRNPAGIDSVAGVGHHVGPIAHDAVHQSAERRMLLVEPLALARRSAVPPREALEKMKDHQSMAVFLGEMPGGLA